MKDLRIARPVTVTAVLLGAVLLIAAHLPRHTLTAHVAPPVLLAGDDTKTGGGLG